MECHRSDLGNQTTYVLRGPVTFADQNPMRQIHADICSGSMSEVILEMGAVDFIDSGALGMLLILRDGARKNGAVLKLRGPSQQVLRVLKNAKLEELFEAI
jgi:anti-anti-sigma factor